MPEIPFCVTKAVQRSKSPRTHSFCQSRDRRRWASPLQEGCTIYRRMQPTVADLVNMKLKRDAFDLNQFICTMCNASGKLATSAAAMRNAAGGQMRTRSIACLAILTLCTGCAAGAVGIAANIVAGASMASLAISGKGLGDQAVSVATGKDCRLLEGMVRSDRGICENYPAVATAEERPAAAEAQADATTAPQPVATEAALRQPAITVQDGASSATRQAQLLAEHCAVAASPTEACAPLVTAGVAVAYAKPAAARGRDEMPAHPVLAAARMERPLSDGPQRAAAVGRVRAASSTSAAAPRGPAAPEGTVSAAPPKPEPVIMLASDSMQITFGGGRSDAEVVKQLQAAIEAWRHAQ
jgi:hypothetical protein